MYEYIYTIHIHICIIFDRKCLIYYNSVSYIYDKKYDEVR